MNLWIKFRRIVADKLGCNRDRVVYHAELINDLGADSLSLTELCMTLEEEFDIEIPDDDIENFVTVKNLYDYVIAAC